MAPYFLGRGACEVIIVEGKRDGCFSEQTDKVISINDNYRLRDDTRLVLLPASE